MSPKLVGLPGSSSPASSPLPLALPLPVPTSVPSRPLALEPRLGFFEGRDEVAANFPERAVYGPNAFACFPGDFERATRDGDLGVEEDVTPNGDGPDGLAVAKGDAAEA